MNLYSPLNRSIKNTLCDHRLLLKVMVESEKAREKELGLQRMVTLTRQPRFHANGGTENKIACHHPPG